MRDVSKKYAYRERQPIPEDGNDCLMRRKDVLARVQLAASTVDVLEQRDRFPRRIVISSRSVRWRRSDIDLWVELGPDGWQRDIAARDQVRVA